MSRAHTHNGSRYAKARSRFRTECESLGLPCHICNRPIDYSLRFPDSWSFTVDHVIPTSLGGDPYDMGNFAPAHLYCNSKRRNNPIERSRNRNKWPREGPIRPTRRWL